jgi:hypothetical protein
MLKLLYPPKSFIQFAENNDGLLANHIARTEKHLRVCCKCNTVRSGKMEKKQNENGVISLKNIEIKFKRR